MGDFRPRDNSNRRRGSSKRGFSDKLQMYDAVCDECGKSCKVPFKPSNDKPIYCSDCFEKKGGNSKSRGGRASGRDTRRPIQGGLSDSSILQLAENVKVLNTKLDKIINLLLSNMEEEVESAKEKTKTKKSSKTRKPTEKKNKKAATK